MSARLDFPQLLRLYNLVQTTRTHQKRIDSFVIYDIAGENCVDSDKISRFGKFIDHSNGIFLLIDPIQFQIIQGFQGVEEEQAGPTRVLQEIHNHVNHGKSNEKRYHRQGSEGTRQYDGATWQ